MVRPGTDAGTALVVDAAVLVVPELLNIPQAVTANTVIIAIAKLKQRAIIVMLRIALVFLSVFFIKNSFFLLL
jgi:hypothetical protein